MAASRPSATTINKHLSDYPRACKPKAKSLMLKLTHYRWDVQVDKALKLLYSSEVPAVSMICRGFRRWPPQTNRMWM